VTANINGKMQVSYFTHYAQTAFIKPVDNISLATNLLPPTPFVGFKNKILLKKEINKNTLTDRQIHLIHVLGNTMHRITISFPRNIERLNLHSFKMPYNPFFSTLIST
jgi:hypothetical protein